MKKQFFKGFHKDKNGLEKILLNGEEVCGRWIEGDGIHYPKSANYKGTCWIDGMAEKANDWVQVIPETVCEFSGQLDMNGSRVYENAVVKIHSVKGVSEEKIGKVSFSNENAMWFITHDFSEYYFLPVCEFEIIGDTFETAKIEIDVLHYTTGVETPNILESGSTLSSVCNTYDEKVAFEKFRNGRNNFLYRTVKKNGRVFREYYNEITKEWE